MPFDFYFLIRKLLLFKKLRNIRNLTRLFKEFRSSIRKLKINNPFLADVTCLTCHQPTFPESLAVRWVLQAALALYWLSFVGGLGHMASIWGSLLIIPHFHDFFQLLKSHLLFPQFLVQLSPFLLFNFYLVEKLTLHIGKSTIYLFGLPEFSL